MIKSRYQELAKVTILCTGLILSKGVLAGPPLDLQESNLIGPKSFVVKPPKYDWEEQKPQGLMKRRSVNPTDYFNKRHPELLDQASKKISYQGSLILNKDINGNIEFDDPRD